VPHSSLHHVADIYRATSQGQGERIQDFWDPPPGLQAEHDLEEQQRDTGQLTVPSHIVPALPESSLIASSTPLSLVSLSSPVSPSLLSPLNDTDDDQFTYTGLLASAAAERVFLDPTPEPTSVAQAMASPDHQHWLQAMLSELANLEGKGTWEEAVLPPGRKPITAKWVFKRKLDQYGKIAKYKARLVARGFSQVPGVDFEETYSPVSRLSSLRLLLTHVTAHDLCIKQADVEGAYLNGNLDVELYLSPPDGIVLNDTSCNVLRLKKSLYGLKQSGRAWWLELSSALELLHFKRIEDEWGLHVRLNNDGSRSFVLIYVDDLLIVDKKETEVDTIISSLASHWKLTPIGYPQHILGIRVHHDIKNSGTIGLSQTAYIDTIAQRYQVTNLRAGKTTPLPSSGELYLDPASPLLDSSSSRRYLELVGILLWLANATRPDLAFTASFLGRYSHCATQETLSFAERALGFAYQTRHLVLHLGGTGNSSELYLYVDSDFAGCTTTRSSTTGYISFVYDSPITWTSRRQAVVAPSTTAAEYVAAAEAVHEIMWLRRVLKQLGITISKPTALFIDNQASINIGLKPIHFARTKHLDIKFHIVREQALKGVVSLSYVPTTSQVADGLTKSLAGPAHASAQRSWRLVLPSTV
jgi:hypothetical protein